MKITWTNERRQVSDLTPADYNPRILSDKDRSDLEDSIKKFDTVEPIVVNTGKRNNTLIGGHQRVKIYADLGIKEIDVRVPSRELTISEETELNLRLNKNVGSWDWEKLKDMELEQLLEVGFGDDELSDIWDDIGTFDDEFDLSQAIKEVQKTDVKPGDVYKLGDHRLMCGDSTDAEQVKKLMAGEKVEMIYCDPPYNIGLDYSKGSNTGPTQKEKKVYREGESSYKTDNVTDEQYIDFVGRTIANAIVNSKNDAHFFYWCDERYIWALQILFQEHKISNKRVCLWIKNNFSLTPQIAFNKAYEPCVYGTRGRPFVNRGIRNLNEVMNKEVAAGNQTIDDIMEVFNLWLVKRDNVNEYKHPTQKPVTLCEKAFKRCTAPGQRALDLFGGSGSTLIACEQLKRKCYMMEIDPIFTQIIINRYEQHTGNKAIKTS